jgi:hypothetical protein
MQKVVTVFYYHEVDSYDRYDNLIILQRFSHSAFLEDLMGGLGQSKKLKAEKYEREIRTDNGICMG